MVEEYLVKKDAALKEIVGMYNLLFATENAKAFNNRFRGEVEEDFLQLYVLLTERDYYTVRYVYGNKDVVFEVSTNFNVLKQGYDTDMEYLDKVMMFLREYKFNTGYLLVGGLAR